MRLKATPLRRLVYCGAAFVAAALALQLGGCGSNRPDTVPVTGTVLYRGQPVAYAIVNFIPEGTRPASAKTDEQGRFSLLTFAPGDGSVLGVHTVVVCKFERAPGGDPDAIYADLNTVAVLPQKYGSPLTSPLKATVTAEGPNDFRFELTD
jgi:hypothetical protein